MPLSDTAIRSAKPQNKPYKLYDAGGLFVIVTPSGGKWWRLGESTLWRWVQEGRIPPGKKIGPRCTIWRRADVLALVEGGGRERETKQPPERRHAAEG